MHSFIFFLLDLTVFLQGPVFTLFCFLLIFLFSILSFFIIFLTWLLLKLYSIFYLFIFFYCLLQQLLFKSLIPIVLLEFLTDSIFSSFSHFRTFSPFTFSYKLIIFQVACLLSFPPSILLTFFYSIFLLPACCFSFFAQFFFFLYLFFFLNWYFLFILCSVHLTVCYHTINHLFFHLYIRVFKKLFLLVFESLSLVQTVILDFFFPTGYSFSNIFMLIFNLLPFPF